jgi:hypothetical protein
LNIRIHTLAEGEITEAPHRAQRHDERVIPERPRSESTWRPKGRAEAHRAAGGLSYGYRLVREIGADARSSEE